MSHSQDELDRLNTWEAAQALQLVKQGLTIKQARLLLALADDSNQNHPSDYAYLLMTSTSGIGRIMNGLSKKRLALADGWDEWAQLKITEAGRQLIKLHTTPYTDK